MWDGVEGLLEIHIYGVYTLPLTYHMGSLVHDFDELCETGSVRDESMLVWAKELVFQKVLRYLLPYYLLHSLANNRRQAYWPVVTRL